MAKILLVEDDSASWANIKDWLEKELHSVEHTPDGRYGLEMALHYKYDVMVLDWELPGISGIEICKRYRESGGSTPVLMLTGRTEVTDRVIGLEAGADDYLSKPFDLRELSARIKALLRRPAGVTGADLRVKNLVLDLPARKLTKDGIEIQLGPKEFALMELFMKHPNQVLSSSAILDRIWPSDSDATSDSLRTYIKRLRKKIDVEGVDSCIKNLPGLGYRFEG